MPEAQVHRPIRSFVLRQGRITEAQARAFDRHWARYGLELGCDGVLMNTAIASAKDPVLMASAMRKAVEAGREAFRAGRIPRKLYATASSPVDGMIE